ncbi:uncharacterized protein GJ701_003637 isoform 1-T3 [Geothlypis trichas]
MPATLLHVSKTCKNVTVLQTEDAEIWIHSGMLDKEHKDLKLSCAINSGFVTKGRVTGRKDGTLHKEVIRGCSNFLDCGSSVGLPTWSTPPRCSFGDLLQTGNHNSTLLDTIRWQGMALSTSTNVHVGIPFPKWSCQSTPCGKKDMSEVAQSERIPAFHKLWFSDTENAIAFYLEKSGVTNCKIKRSSKRAPFRYWKVAAGSP